jgi:hypothetical protein
MERKRNHTLSHKPSDAKIKNSYSGLIARTFVSGSAMTQPEIPEFSKHHGKNQHSHPTK